MWKPPLNVAEVREDHQRSECHDDPRPRAHSVVEQVEQQGRAQRVVFALGGQHPLDEIAAAARFRSRVVRRPPLHQQRDEEDGSEIAPIRCLERRPECQPAPDFRMLEQAGQAADLGQAHDIDRGRNRADHGHRELDHVRQQHALQAPEGAVSQGDAGRDQDGLDWTPAEHHRADLDCRQSDGSHDQHVEDESQIDSSESPQEGGRAAGVAEFVELHVGRYARPSPELRVQEHRQHSRQQEGPPSPVPEHAVAAHDVRDEIRRVSREGGRDHRDPQQPPRLSTAREEIRREIAAGSAGYPQTDA